MRFKYLEDLLARFMEELSRNNFKVIYWRDTEQNSVDALSRKEDNLAPCDCYRVGTRIEDLPCGGCQYCSKMHRQLVRLNDDVDDAVPLAVCSVHAGLTEQALSELIQSQIGLSLSYPSNNGMPNRMIFLRA